MKLTINKKYKAINMMHEVELLSDIHRQQLELAVKTSFGDKRLTLKKFFKEEGSFVDFSEILDEQGKPLYDFWEIDVDTGQLFIHNSIELLPIVMIQSCLTLNNKESAKDEETTLLSDLESANTTHNLLMYKYNKNQEIIDFIDTPAPKNSKAWTEFISKKTVGEELIKNYSDRIDKKCWDNIILLTQCSGQFLEKFRDKINWDLVSEYQNLSEDFIEKNQENINWKLLSTNNKTELSENFIEKFQNKLNWKEISETQKLSEDFIIRHRDQVDWKAVSWHQTLSNEFIINHKDKLDWKGICYHQKLTEETIREYATEFSTACWSGISWNQTLSIPFLEEFKKKIDWKEFSKNRGGSLTKEVLRKYADKIRWDEFITDWSGPGLSEELVKEFLPFFSKYGVQYLLEDPENFPLSKEYRKQLNEVYESMK